MLQTKDFNYAENRNGVEFVNLAEINEMIKRKVISVDVNALHNYHKETRVKYDK